MTQGHDLQKFQEKNLTLEVEMRLVLNYTWRDDVVIEWRGRRRVTGGEEMHEHLNLLLFQREMKMSSPGCKKEQI